MLQATRAFGGRAPLLRCSRNLGKIASSSSSARTFSSSSSSCSRAVRRPVAVASSFSTVCQQQQHVSVVVSRSSAVSRFTTPQLRLYSAAAGEEVVVKVPNMGDSITSGTINTWLKKKGDAVLEDDIVCQIDTDKVTADVRSPVAGVIMETVGNPQDNANVGDVLFKVKKGAAAAAAKPAEAKPTAKDAEAKPEQPAPAAAKPAEAKQPAEPPKPAAPQSAKPVAVEAAMPTATGSRTERRVPMSRMRLRIAERLKDSQNTSAMLTTFNEVDMSKLMDLRNKYKDEFEKKHGVKLGFMSAFVKASAMALQEQPSVNAVIDGKDIVYRDYIDISVAVATPTGLVVPVIRDCQNRSFASIEKTIGDFGERARVGKLAIEEMQGGTFTISNGGVFGSLYGTPIINPPQSAILGMHTVKWRPICDPENNNAIVARPMMYLALTYDHRLIDGKDAVTFLVRIKNCIEDPRRFLLEL